MHKQLQILQYLPQLSLGFLLGILLLAPLQPVAASPRQPQREAAAPAVWTDNPGVPNSGWVQARPINGGCNGGGSCSGGEGNWVTGLYEYTPDRDERSREPNGFETLSPPQPSLAQHGGHTTAVARQVCHIDSPSPTRYYGWSAGTWHHGAYWSRNVNTGVWDGPNSPHWAFWHDDLCRPKETPTPSNTAIPTATFTPRGLTVSVLRCTSGGPLLDGGLVTITAWAGSWSVSQQTSRLSADVPGQYSQASFSVTINSAWSVSEGRTNATVGLPHGEVIVAWNSSCVVEPPSTASPTPNTPPPPCQRWHQFRWESIPLVAPRNVLNRTNQLVTLPTSPDGTLPELRSDQTSFEFWNDKAFWFDADDDWDGSSVVARRRDEFGISVELTNVSTGGTFIGRTGLSEHIWESPHGNWAVLREYPYTGLARAPRRLGTWPGWSAQSWPLHRAIDAGQAGIGVTFAGTLPEGIYRLRVRSEQIGGNGWTLKDWDDGRADLNCPLGYRDTAFYFRVGMAPTPTPTTVGTPTPTRTGTVATPTRTPTPTPPPPPRANATFQLQIHSRHDPAHGVYQSTSSTVSWPQGEVLDWTPAIKLELPPSPTNYYFFRARVVAWSFVSSVGKDAKVDPDDLGCTGCRLREGPTAQDLQGTNASGLSGCVYRYLPAPTAAEMAGQAHTFWSPLETELPAEIYVYHLQRLQAVDLVAEVKVLVEVVQTSTGAVVGSATQIERGTFTVNLVAPRTAK